MVTDADILELVKTKDDARQLQKDITAVIDALFSDAQVIEMLHMHLPYEKKEKLLALMRIHQIPLTDASLIQQFLQQLISRSQELPVITITLAFEPKQQLVTSLSAWFAVHAKKAVLLDILVDKKLIGGAIIASNGIYKDYSVKKILEEKYKKGEITL